MLSAARKFGWQRGYLLPDLVVTRMSASRQQTTAVDRGPTAACDRTYFHNYFTRVSSLLSLLLSCRGTATLAGSLCRVNSLCPFYPASTMKLKHLQSALESVRDFSDPNFKLEQYRTSAHLAAAMLFAIEGEFGDIEDRVVADFGCTWHVLI